jgi:O-antigen/teichoic acid export membrane protein
VDRANFNQSLGPTSRKLNSSLAHGALNALKWRYAGTLFEVGFRLLVNIVLARLLLPETFGLIGMAILVVGFGRLFGDMGLGVAIIQRPSITQRHIRVAFTASSVMGVLLFSAIWALAPALSGLFMQDALTPVLRVAAISLVFAAASAAPISLLRRELRFRTLATIESCSYIVGYGVVGLLLAVLDYGVWSLVAASIAQMICLATLAMHLTRLPVWPFFCLRDYYDLIRVASAEVLNNVTNFFAENLDFFVIGRWLGASALGLYNRSFFLLDIPVRNFSAALFSVMFPVLSQIEADAPRLGRAFILIVSITALVTIPLFCTMAVVPGVILGGLLGERWKEAAGVLQILCLSGPFMAMIHVFGALSHARGYIFREWGRQAIYLAFMGIALLSMLPYGIEGIALAVALATLTRYLLLAHLSTKLASIHWSQLLLAQVPGCLLGITVSVSVYTASAVGNFFAVSDLMQLLLIIPVFLLSWILSFLIIPASWSGDLYFRVSERFGVQLPCWLQKVITTKIAAKPIETGST